MEVNDLFYPNYTTKKKIVVNQGGTWSAKTYTILQVLHQKATESKVVITIVGQDVPNLKKGAIRDMMRILTDPSAAKYLKGGSVKIGYNQSDKILTYKNGSIIEFTSYKDEQDAKSGKRDYLFVNEANGISYVIFWQLFIRTGIQTFVDYNPSARFWVHEQLLPREDCILIISDHRRNRFITQEMHDEIEAISDRELFKVYARGMTGKITGLVLGHFKRIYEMPKCDRYVWGIDYGYTNDPTAIVKIGIIGRIRYYQECCYVSAKDENFHEYLNELVPSDFKPQTMGAVHIKEVFMRFGWQPGQPIYSEHDSDMILQLRKLKLPVAQARKERVPGLSKMKEFESYYIGENFHNEVMNYKFVTVTDALTGKTVYTNEPMDGDDHLCDAGRYGCYTDTLVNRNNL